MTPKPPLPGRTARAEAASLESSPRPARGVWVALALICVVVFLPALRGGFVSDDSLLLPHLRQTVETRGLGAIFREEMFALETGVRIGFYRPIGSLSLALDQALYGSNPTGYHVSNLVLHVLATWLVLGLSLHVGSMLAPAIATAALFAVHPVHVEAVAWISGRFDLLCGVLMLLALWLFARAHAVRAGWAYAGALVAATTALLSKEMALTLPAAILLIDGFGLSRGRGPRRLVASGLWREGWQGTLVRALPFVAIVVAYLVLRVASRRLGFDATSGAERLPALELVCTAGGAFSSYLGMLLFPIRLNAYPMVPSLTSPVEPRFLAGFLLLVGLGIAALRLRKRHPIAAFGILLFLASLVPLSNAVGTYVLARDRFPIAERYLYFPSFAYLLTGATLAWTGAVRFGATRIFAAGCAVLGLAFGVRSLLRIPAWRSDEALFTDTVQQDPQSPWAHLLLAGAQRRNGDVAGAESHLMRALEIDPKLYPAIVEIAALRARAGRHSEAAALYEQALDIEPRGRDARLGLALALRRAGRLPEAAQQYTLLGDLGARDSEFLVNRGELYLATGQLDAAGRDFAAALEVNPRRKEAVYNLGVIALRRGEPEAAEMQARHALEIDPTDAMPHLLLGNIAVARGDYVAAASEFGQGAALDSTNVQLLVNQGAALLNVGDFPRAVEVLRRSLRIAPTAHGWVNLAEAERRSASPVEAEAAYRAALAIDGDMQPALRGLGILLAADPERAAEARQLLAPLAAALPEDAEVRAALESLDQRPR